MWLRPHIWRDKGVSQNKIQPEPDNSLRRIAENAVHLGHSVISLDYIALVYIYLINPKPCLAEVMNTLYEVQEVIQISADE